MPSEIEITGIMCLIGLFIILLSVIIWNYLWIKEYGGVIPNPQFYSEDEITYFNSKNFDFVVSELWERIKSFEKVYMLRSCGIESYVYLIFQRKLLKTMLSMAILSLLFSLVGVIIKASEAEEHFLNAVYDILLNNKYINDYTAACQLISLIIMTFLHFSCFFNIKNEVKHLYFERFDRMSREKNVDWLSCRTLHVSGLLPEERNTNILKTKLDIFLNKVNGGRVIDINFIPNYNQMIELEIEKAQINDVKNLISKAENSCIRRWFFPKIFRNELTIKMELNRLDNEITKLIESPVYSSGHAFVTFDSLVSAYKCLVAFQEDTFKKLKLKCRSIVDKVREITPGIDDSGNSSSQRVKRGGSTFGRFTDEDLQQVIMDPNKVDIIVDQMIEPVDIIWTNVGGDRGLYVCRRILCVTIGVAVLVFLSTPTTLFSSLKQIEYLNKFDLGWVPFKEIIQSYAPPIIIILLNQVLLLLIDIAGSLERHFTHSRYQNSIFSKSYFYLLMNMLIIPGISISSARSLYQIIFDKNYNIPTLLGEIYLFDSGSFFVNIIIQTSIFGNFFYFTRLDELLKNSFSPFFAFYSRHFKNTSKPWVRSEGDLFQFGFFYAQMLTIYSIALIFSSTVPFVCVAALIYFSLKHTVDFTNLLTLHRAETDSGGDMVNNVINYSNISIFFFQFVMTSFFIVKKKYDLAIIAGVLFLISLIFMYYLHTRYIFDFYSLHEKMKDFELISERMSSNEITKWRNKYKHPLILPVAVKDSSHSRFPSEVQMVNIVVNNNENKDELGPGPQLSKFASSEQHVKPKKKTTL